MNDSRLAFCEMLRCMAWSLFSKFPDIYHYYHATHCLKIVRIRSYSGLIFPHSDWIRRDTEYLSVFNPNGGKCGPEKLRTKTFFTQWLMLPATRLAFICFILRQKSRRRTRFHYLFSWRSFLVALSSATWLYLMIHI